MFKRITIYAIQYVGLVLGVFLINPETSFQQYLGLAILFFLGLSIVTNVARDVILIRDFMKHVGTVKDAQDWERASDLLLKKVQELKANAKAKAAGLH